MKIQADTRRINQRRWFCVLAVTQALAAAFIGLLVGISVAGTRPEPFNKVVVIVDGSGSYSSRRMEAIDRAVALLNSMSQKKLHRWESASDRITIISLDAIPEALWEGSLHELKTMDSEFWTAHFQARTDYVDCTDVTAAFRLAARYLEGDPRYVHKYLFVFSDLIDEPPTDSIYRPRKPSRLPTGDFPWEALRDVSVSVFWVPPEQKLIWHRAVEERGLGASFALYTTSESAEVAIQPPPKPRIELTENERKTERERYVRYAWTFVKVAAIVMAVMGVLMGFIVFAARRSRQRRSSRVLARRVVPPIQQANAHGPGSALPPAGTGSMDSKQATPYRGRRRE